MSYIKNYELTPGLEWQLTINTTTFTFVVNAIEEMIDEPTATTEVG
jgi:hypothetical protein